MNRTPFFNFDKVDKSIDKVNKNWGDFRRAINEGRFSYNDLESALNHGFLKTFNELFNECKNVAGLTKKLDTVNYKNKIMRGAKISDDEYENEIEYSRFLPKKEYIKDDNRFSPKGIEWLYLAISDDPSQAKECCIQECRAKKNDKFANVSFNIPDEYFDSDVVDLTVGTMYEYTELESYLETSTQINFEKVNQKVVVPNKVKKMRKSKQKKYIDKRIKEEIAKNSPNNRERLVKFLTLMYSKLISENIFEPVDETDKSEKYAPFHCLAQYFITKGYSGIIYSSTVFEKGKNIVLFDKNFASPVGEISKFIV